MKVLRKNVCSVLFAVFMLVLSGSMVFAAGQKEASSEPVVLDIMGPWSASEQEAFQVVLDGFTEKTGIEVRYEAAEDVIKVLGPRLAADETPDLAILPVANGLKELVAQDAIVSLNSMKSEIESSFSQGWLDQFTFDGEIMAIPTRASVSNLFWFDPSKIDGDPSTWMYDDFTDYADKLVAAGEKPVASIAKTSWTLTGLIEDMFLGSYGVDEWVKLMTNQTPWTDPKVVAAFEKIADYYGGSYVAGGGEGAMGTDLVGGISRVFGTDADAKFVIGGGWVAGIAKSAINENLVEGETIDFIVFPPGSDAGKGAVIAAADVAVQFSDSSEATQLMEYLISAEGQALFAPSGYTVANYNVSPSLYTGLTARSAEYLSSPTAQIAPSNGAMLANEKRGALMEVIQSAILNPAGIEASLAEFQKNYGDM